MRDNYSEAVENLRQAEQHTLGSIDEAYHLKLAQVYATLAVADAVKGLDDE